MHLIASVGLIVKPVFFLSFAFLLLALVLPPSCFTVEVRDRGFELWVANGWGSPPLGLGLGAVGELQWLQTLEVGWRGTTGKPVRQRQGGRRQGCRRSRVEHDLSSVGVPPN
jgi:hypothetical protein